MSSGMTAIRDNLCELGRMEIPRPKCQGMQFVATRGRQGFYRTIRENGAKYGLQIKPQGPKRPTLSSDLFSRPMTVPEEKGEEEAQEETQPYQPKQYQHVSPPQQQQRPQLQPQPPRNVYQAAETREVEQNNNNYKVVKDYSRSRLPPMQPKMLQPRTGGITQSINNRPISVAAQEK